MRRAAASGLIGLAILLGTAQPASAQWRIIKWLEDLSGPGKFTMWSAETHFGCFKKELPVAQDEQASTDAFNTGPTWLKTFFCDQNPTVVGKTGREVWRDVGLYFTAAYAQSFAGHDPLQYPAGAVIEDTSVKTFSAGPAYRFNRWVDAGMTLGNANFTGATSVSFNKFMLNPNVVVRPLAGASNDWRQIVSVRLDFLIFPQGFTDADFGAISNKLSGDAELVTSLVVGVDFARFLGWKK